MAWRKINIGQKFGRLTVISKASLRGDKFPKWQCDCECGGSTIAGSGELNRGAIVSCGCKRKEIISASGFNNKTHGETIGKKSKEYRAWKAIKQRCYNPKVESYKYYGGRGITVASEWLDSFEAFLAHVGRCPDPSFSIDRIDNDKGYEPGNVRWASAKQQANNKRK